MTVDIIFKSSPVALKMEEVIRDMAARVISAAITRRDHPTFGYTKTGIRQSIAEMEGAIQVHMILTGQTESLGVSGLAKFNDESTAERVFQARHQVARMNATK